jgi:cytochrome P450
MSELDPKRHIAKFKNISSGYAFSNIIKSEPYIDNAIKILEKQLDKLSKENKPVHFDHWFNYFGFDVLGEVTFSQRFGFLEEGRDIGDAIANTKMLGGYIAIMGHFYWLHDWLLANPLIGWLNLQPSMHIFDTTLAAVERRSKNDEARKDMLEQWKETRAKFPERMEEKEILAAAVVNVGAGVDTISATLQAFFYYLLRNQAAFKRLREEIDEAQAKGQLSDPVSHAEAQNLPYLQACVRSLFLQMRHFSYSSIFSGYWMFALRPVRILSNLTSHLHYLPPVGPQANSPPTDQRIPPLPYPRCIRPPPRRTKRRY